MAPRQRWGETRSDSSLSKPSVRLSCELCRQRKVKCDKLNPCTNCQRSGTRCVPVERARLPPGRSGKSVRDSGDGDSALRERVSRLEELIEHINEEKAKGKQSRDLSQNAHRNTTELLPDFPRWRHGSNPVSRSASRERSSESYTDAGSHRIPMTRVGPKYTDGCFPCEEKVSRPSRASQIFRQTHLVPKVLKKDCVRFSSTKSILSSRSFTAPH